MASAMLHMSMLPAIKCSTCGAEVELSMMGDHICMPTTTTTIIPDHVEPERAPSPLLFEDDKSSSVPEANPLEQPHRAPSISDIHTIHPISQLSAEPDAQSPIEHTGAVEPTPLQPSLRSVKQLPPRIDLQAANDFESNSYPLLSPSSVASGTLSQGTAPQSPFVHTPRSDTTVSTFARSPTPDVFPSNDGESWPRFPVEEKPAPAPAVTPAAAPSRAKSLRKKMSALAIQTDHSRGMDGLAPLSPSLQSSANVMKRMNTISPGPFEAKHKKSESKDGGVKSSIGSIFRRKSTKKKSMDKISAPTLITAAPPPLPAAPASFGDLSSRQSLRSDRSSTPPKIDDFGQPLPTGPAPRRPSRPEFVGDVLQQLRQSSDSLASGAGPAQVTLHDDHPAPSGFSMENATSDTHIHTNQAAPSIPPAPRPRVASDASVYTTVSTSERSTVMGKGLPQISEDEGDVAETTDGSVPPPAWPSGRLRSLSRSSDASSKNKVDNVPPLPTLASSMDYMRHHASSESLSSADTRSVFDDQSRRESARSSPPTSTTSSFSPRKQSLDEPQNDGRAATTDPLPSGPTLRPSKSFSRPRAPTETEALSPTKIGAGVPKLPAPRSKSTQRTLSPTAIQSPASPTESPVVSQGGLTLPRGSSKYVGPGKFSLAPASPMFPSVPIPPIPQDEPRPNSRGRRRSSSAKQHCCRGCGLQIEGKSIKAADGRLTGRWHRECFVCKACKERFQSADFYIINDEPYCAEHYHIVNESLCSGCNRGIEGQYLETQQRQQKYHLYCLTCTDCLRPLSKDYFEMDDKLHCETCASKAHNKSNLLTPGRKFPERRTTRLMMM